MPSSSVRYDLRRIRSSTDPVFAEAITIYTRAVESSIRTNSNEIAFWLDETARATTTERPFEFVVYAFIVDGVVAGYAEAAYLEPQELYVLDYLVLEESYRGHNTFFEFAAQLGTALEVEHPGYRYAVVEVPTWGDHAHPSDYSRLLIRLLKLQGFKVAEAPYVQPRLGLDHAESEMPAFLLLSSRDRLTSLPTSTYLRIVDAIYFHYYLPWYARTGHRADAYREHLTRLTTALERQLSQGDPIRVNGLRMVLARAAQPAQSHDSRLLTFATRALLLIAAVTLVMLVARAALRIDWTEAAAIYSLVLISFLATVAVLSGAARKVLSRVSDRGAGGHSRLCRHEDNVASE